MAKKCVVCDETIAGREENGHYPFCSSRCRQVDLGRWLNEEIVIRVSREESERDDLPTGDPSDR